MDDLETEEVGYNGVGSYAVIGQQLNEGSQFQYKYYIAMGENSICYLFPDGKVNFGCLQDDGTHGYYDTEELAQEALTKYKEENKC